MRLLVLFTLSICFFYSGIYCQENNRKRQSRKKDSVIIPDAEIYKEPFITYKPATIFLKPDHIVKEQVYLRKNFTDQMLEVAYEEKYLPASRIYGFIMDNKYYRSGYLYLDYYVFAELLLQGKMSLYYCRKFPNVTAELDIISMDPANREYRNRMIVEDDQLARYKNDFHYFITMSTDTSKMIYIDDYDNFATDYLKACPTAYEMSKELNTKRKYKWERSFAISAVSYVISLNHLQGTEPKVFNVRSPFLYVSGISFGIATYQFFKSREWYPDLNLMYKIVDTYNQCE